jgi:hypothetical protein
MISALPGSRRIQRSVVRVEDGADHGTAFLINQTASFATFLTAFHVVYSAWRQGRGVLLRIKDHTLTADIDATDADRDVALLKAQVPPSLGLRAPAIATISRVGRLTVFEMLDPDAGIVAPLQVAISSVGETAVAFEIGESKRVIDGVWSQQGLRIIAGTSGAPVVSEEDQAIVAIACAGVDALEQAFFVPLISVRRPHASPPTQAIAEAIDKAAEATIRLGRQPNPRGIALRCWLQTRRSANSLAISGVYDPRYTISRESLETSVQKFLASERHVALLAGTSGSGKSAGLARLARSQQLSRPCLFLRAAQVEISQHPLEDALAKALGMAGADSLGEMAISELSPLLIIDGFNELAIAREGWRSFVRVHLAQLINILQKKGWKLLISTRVDRLSDLHDVQELVSLYNPTPDTDGTVEVARTFDPGEKKLPFIPLIGFERREFDYLIQLHGLPGGLPFSELRHPILFRLAVEAYKNEHTTQLRIRELFNRYLSGLVIAIHARSPGRSRDRIPKLLESWTALPETTALGYIDSASLGDPQNEAIAEAAVAEGLFERVPNGYRYIYDEISDFVRARTLIADLASCAEATGAPIIATIDKLLGSGCTSGTVARALEMLSVDRPDVFKKLAQELTAELKVRNVADPAPGRMIPIRKLRGIIRVLALVEKGGPLDEAKDCSPIFGIGGLEPGIEWSNMSPVPYLISDDHISYAFDEERMWRIGRLAAINDSDRDSYPFRLKDLRNDVAYETAKKLLNGGEVFKVLKHFVTGFPERALERLTCGLVDHQPIGREHTFSSFCAQAILVFADRFELASVLRSLVQQPYVEAREALGQIVKLYPDESLSIFLRDDIGFVEQPLLAAEVLNFFLTAVPSRADKITEIAAKLVAYHDHPVSSYSRFYAQWGALLPYGFVANAVRREWFSGGAPLNSLIECAATALLSWGEAFDMILERLRRTETDLHLFVSSLGSYWKHYSYFTRDPSRLDLIVAAIWAGHPNITGAHAYAAEVLLNLAVHQGVWSQALQTFIEEVCKANPTKGARTLRFSIAEYAFGRLSEDLQKQICDSILSSFENENVRDVIDLCLERAPKTFRTRYLIEYFVNKFGSKELFELARDEVEFFRSNDYTIPEEWMLLVAYLRELDRETFEEYENHFHQILPGA